MHKFITLAFTGFLVLSVTACGGGSGTTPVPGSPIDVSGAITGEKAKKSLYVISAGVVALGGMAVTYANLPRCPTTTNVCSSQPIIDEMAKAYRMTDLAMTNAETFIQANPSGDAGDVLRAANLAMATFQSLALANNLPTLAK